MALSEFLKSELDPFGVDVTVLCPDGAKTNLLDSGRNRQRRFGGPEAGRALNRQFVIETEAFATHTLSAIKNNELYLFTHPYTQQKVEVRATAIYLAVDSLDRRGSPLL